MPAILTVRAHDAIASRGIGLTTIAVLFSILIILFVALRTVRTVKTRSVGLEDVLIWFATVLVTTHVPSSNVQC